MSVLACVGCCLAASTRQRRVAFTGVVGMWVSLQRRNHLHTYTVSNFRSCCWTLSYLVFLPLRRWQKTVRISPCCLYVMDSMTDMTAISQTHLTWECLKKHTRRCTAWCILVDGGSDESSQQAGNLHGEKCCGVLVCWQSDPDVVTYF